MEASSYLLPTELKQQHIQFFGLDPCWEPTEHRPHTNSCSSTDSGYFGSPTSTPRQGFGHFEGFGSGYPWPKSPANKSSPISLKSGHSETGSELWQMLGSPKKALGLFGVDWGSSAANQAEGRPTEAGFNSDVSTETWFESRGPSPISPPPSSPYQTQGYRPSEGFSTIETEKSAVPAVDLIIYEWFLQAYGNGNFKSYGRRLPQFETQGSHRGHFFEHGRRADMAAKPISSFEIGVWGEEKPRRMQDASKNLPLGPVARIGEDEVIPQKELEYLIFKKAKEVACTMEKISLQRKKRGAGRQTNGRGERREVPPRFRLANSGPPDREVRSPPKDRNHAKIQCEFCLNNARYHTEEKGEIFDESKGEWNLHQCKNKLGEVVCPILSRHVCGECGATGKWAHTMRYCPVKKAKILDNLKSKKLR